MQNLPGPRRHKREIRGLIPTHYLTSGASRSSNPTINPSSDLKRSHVFSRLLKVHFMGGATTYVLPSQSQKIFGASVTRINPSALFSDMLCVFSSLCQMRQWYSPRCQHSVLENGWKPSAMLHKRLLGGWQNDVLSRWIRLLRWRYRCAAVLLGSILWVTFSESSRSAGVWCSV